MEDDSLNPFGDRKKVAVFGEIFSPNLGDGIIFECVKHLFKTQGIEAIPVDLSGRKSFSDALPRIVEYEDAGLIRKIGRIPLRRSRQMRRTYSACSWYFRNRAAMSVEWESVIASSDAVVVGGGQLLTDVNFGFPPKIYEIMLLAKRHNKPLAFFGCGVGGGWDYFSRRMYSEALDYAKYVSVRDHPSAELLRLHTSIDSKKLEVHPDPAFIVEQIAGPFKRTSGNKTIGFNFQPAMHFRNFVPALQSMTNEAYIDFWYKLILGSCRAGENVMILSNGDPGDHFTAKTVADELSKCGVDVEIADRPMHPAEMITQISRLSTLVCTRMHAGIVAFGLGKKVVPISWNAKVDGVWNEIGLSDIVIQSEAVLQGNPWPYFSERIVRTRPKRFDIDGICNQISVAAKRCIASLGVN